MDKRLSKFYKTIPQQQDLGRSEETTQCSRHQSVALGEASLSVGAQVPHEPEVTESTLLLQGKEGKLQHYFWHVSIGFDKLFFLKS